MKIKRWIGLLMLLLLCGCSGEGAPQMAPAEETTAAVPSAVFSDLVEVQNFIAENQQKENLTFSFCYDGSDPSLTAQIIARMGSFLYVECVQQESVYQITAWEYPGVRMVRAYRGGDWTDLTPEEKQALSVAVEMVNQAREASDTPLELELALFDGLRNHVAYHDGSPEIADPEDPPRYLTAVGALVDGSANCQGYADAFYVLASLADFSVDKLSVDTPRGGHVVNVIRLDGQWYVVDVTYNDQPQQQVSYRLFNAGLDQCGEYSWESFLEKYPICPVSDEKYYYHSGFDGRTKTFSHLEAMAEAIVQTYLDDGTKVQYRMLEGTVAHWSDLSDVLAQKAGERGIAIRYHIWAENDQCHTWYYIEIQ